VANLVGDVSSHSIVPTIAEPNLEQSLLGSQGDGGSNDFRLLKLFTYTNISSNKSEKWSSEKAQQHIWSESNILISEKNFMIPKTKITGKRLLTNHGEENRFPHLVNIVLFLDLEDNYSSFGRIL